MATNIIQAHFRPSDILLDRVLNPTRDPNIGAAVPADIIEACGIIPDFFCAACIETSNTEIPQTLESVAEAMDEAYGFGGFKYAWSGNVTDRGVYEATNDDDPDMAPLARFGFEGRFFCYIYDYGVAAIVDRESGQFKVARFD